MKYPLMIAALVCAFACSSSTGDSDSDGDSDSGGDDAGDSSPTDGDACTPGAFRCTAANRIERCESSLTWQDFGQCTVACVDGVCTGECSPGSTQCCMTDSTGLNCGINDIQKCTGGTQCPDPGAVFVRRCSPLGTWLPDPGCQNCLVATGIDISYAVCRVCDLPQGGGTEAKCDDGQDCNGENCIQ